MMLGQKNIKINLTVISFDVPHERKTLQLASSVWFLF